MNQTFSSKFFNTYNMTHMGEIYSENFYPKLRLFRNQQVPTGNIES